MSVKSLLSDVSKKYSMRKKNANDVHDLGCGIGTCKVKNFGIN